MQSPRPLLDGAKGESAVHLGLAGRPRRLGLALALRGVRFLVGRIFGGAEPLFQVCESGKIRVAGGQRGIDGRPDPIGFALRRAGLRPIVTQLLGHRRQGRIRLVKSGQGHVHTAYGIKPLRVQIGQFETQPFSRRGHLGESARCLVVRRLDLDEAGLISRTASGEVLAPGVAGAGHRAKTRVVARPVGEPPAGHPRPPRLASSRASAPSRWFGASTTSTAYVA